MNKRFTRKIEHFTCLNCAAEVRGNGFTNHCPQCLWSRHVDVNPGDRAASCKGLMRPVRVITTHGVNSLLHQCTNCRFERKNKLAKNDDFEKVLEIISGATARHTDRTSRQLDSTTNHPVDNRPLEKVQLHNN